MNGNIIFPVDRIRRLDLCRSLKTVFEAEAHSCRTRAALKVSLFSLVLEEFDCFSVRSELLIYLFTHSFISFGTFFFIVVAL